MEIGMGITLILALIGIMNYVNTVLGSIQSRQMELAVMESVGMTGKQVRGMLLREGLLFAAEALVLTATVGLGITCWIFQSMNYMQIPFTVPIVPVLLMGLSVTVICVTIPLIAYQALAGRRTVVERLRGME